MSLNIESQRPFAFFTNSNRNVTLQDIQQIFPGATRFEKLLTSTGLLVTGTALTMYAVWAGYTIEVKGPILGTTVLCRLLVPVPGQNYRAETGASVPTSMISAYADYTPDSTKYLEEREKE